MANFREYLKEAEEPYKELNKYPKARNMVGKVSKELDWDIFGAMGFCLHLLEDVNAHKEMKEVEQLFKKQMREW